MLASRLQLKGTPLSLPGPSPSPKFGQEGMGLRLVCSLSGPNPRAASPSAALNGPQRHRVAAVTVDAPFEVTQGPKAAENCLTTHQQRLNATYMAPSVDPEISHLDLEASQSEEPEEARYSQRRQSSSAASGSRPSQRASTSASDLVVRSTRSKSGKRVRRTGRATATRATAVSAPGAELPASVEGSQEGDLTSEAAYMADLRSWLRSVRRKARRRRSR